MIKPSSYILTLYKEKGDEDTEIDNETIRKEILSPLVTSLDFLSKLRELAEDDEEEENGENGGDDL